VSSNNDVGIEGLRFTRRFVLSMVGQSKGRRPVRGTVTTVDDGLAVTPVDVIVVVVVVIGVDIGNS